MFPGDNRTGYVLLCIVYQTYYTLFIESTVLASNQCSTLARVCPSQLDEPWILKQIGRRGWDRTIDTRIKSPVLYQLSYTPYILYKLCTTSWK